MEGDFGIIVFFREARGLGNLRELWEVYRKFFKILPKTRQNDMKTILNDTKPTLNYIKPTLNDTKTPPNDTK